MTRPHWKQLGSLVTGGLVDHYERDDGRASAERFIDGLGVASWRVHVVTDGKRLLFARDLQSAEAAMELADRTVPMGGEG